MSTICAAVLCSQPLLLTVLLSTPLDTGMHALGAAVAICVPTRQSALLWEPTGAQHGQ